MYGFQNLWGKNPPDDQRCVRPAYRCCAVAFAVGVESESDGPYSMRSSAPTLTCRGAQAVETELGRRTGG